MNRTQWLIIIVAFILTTVWATFHYFQMQYTLSQPLALNTTATVTLPKSTTRLSTLNATTEKSLEPFRNDRIWGIVQRIDPKNPTPDALIFTPALGGKPARICVGITCYEYIGRSGKNVLFYDTNVSATKKTLSLSQGSKLFKTVRISKLTPQSVTLIDTKTKNEYEISQFTIDLEPYKPKSDTAKGTPKK